MKTKPLSRLFEVALKQFLEDQERRFAVLVQAAAETDNLSVKDGWRLDAQKQCWVLLQENAADGKSAPKT